MSRPRTTPRGRFRHQVAAFAFLIACVTSIGAMPKPAEAVSDDQWRDLAVGLQMACGIDVSGRA